MGLRQNIKNLNHNIRLGFLFSIFSNIGQGIWSGTALSMYIYLFENNSNIAVGWTAGVMGIAMTITVIPVGYFADKSRRDIFLKIAAVLGFLSVITLIIFSNIYAIYTSLALWGIYQGFTRPSLEALLADSTVSESRPRIYTILHLVRQLSASIGPFLGALLFYFLGDEWEITILRTVMLFGIIIQMIALGSMFFFNDSRDMGEKSEINPQLFENEKDTIYNQSSTRKIFSILISSSLIIGIGAGMTLKYFSTFFKEQYFLSPASVSLIMGFTAIFTGLASITVQKLSKSKGRIQMIFAFESIATICLFIIATYPSLWILIPIFIMRGSFMNAGEPLSRSILMEIVPKKHRAKVNSIQTIAWGLFWNFSAVIGGYLVGDVEPYNFRLNFIVTACIYVIGVTLLLFLFPKLKRKNKSTI